MKKHVHTLETYCSAAGLAYAAANPASRYAAAVIWVQRACMIINDKDFPGRPSARTRNQYLECALQEKETAYWTTPALCR